MWLKRFDGNVPNLFANICSCKQFPRNVTKTHKHVSFCCIQKSSQSDFWIPFVNVVAGDTQQTAQQRYEPSPPHTRLSHDDPNTISSSCGRWRFGPAPCLCSVYFKPFSSSHLCRSLTVSAGSRQPRQQNPVAPVGVETICLQQDEPRSSDSEPLSAACWGSPWKKQPRGPPGFYFLIYVIQQFQ